MLKFLIKNLGRPCCKRMNLEYLLEEGGWKNGNSETKLSLVGF